MRTSFARSIGAAAGLGAALALATATFAADSEYAHHAMHAGDPPAVPMDLRPFTSTNAVVNFACCSYSPQTVTITAGESVTWNGSFLSHPLQEVDGPTSDDPVIGGFHNSSGTTYTRAFPNPGEHYYQCTVHGTGAGTMRGKVNVLPATDVPGGPSVDASRLSIVPNPVLRGATIGFSLARPSDVDLAVFDLNGRVVRQLQSARMPAGNQRLDWDGLDSGGRVPVSGIYFVQLVTERFRLRSKVVKLH